jgi:lipopolysaccharide export system permease protein
MTSIGKYQAPFYLIFEYLLYNLPEVAFKWTLPYAVLLSILLTLGNLSRHSEITALKAGGVSLYRITLPLFFVVFLISIANFLGNEYLVPFTYQKSRYVWEVKIKKEKPTSFFKNFKIWYRSDNRIINIQVLDPQKKALNGVTLYQLDDQFRCVQRVDAREVRWINGEWRFYEGALRNFGEDGSLRMTPFREMNFPLNENWESFQRVQRDSEEMSYTELRTYIQNIHASGYNATRYLVELNAKLSLPFLNLIMVLIGIPFALKTSRSGGVAMSVGLSVLIAFIFGVIYYIFLSVGKTGILPPVLSAWTPTLLFGLAGTFTLMSVRQ